jgi:hypothetical protein
VAACRKGRSRYTGAIAVIAAVGFGSFAFHTLATRWAMWLDVVPIGLFIYGYFLLAMRRFLLLSWSSALMLLVGFIALSTVLGSLVPREVLNGSSGYLPALAALIILGSMLRRNRVGQTLLVAAGLFVVSLTFRIVDLDVCVAWPLGTHFLWHLLNAALLYAVIWAAVEERQQPLGRELR